MQDNIVCRQHASGRAQNAVGAVNEKNRQASEMCTDNILSINLWS